MGSKEMSVICYHTEQGNVSNTWERVGWSTWERGVGVPRLLKLHFISGFVCVHVFSMYAEHSNVSAVILFLQIAKEWTQSRVPW